MADRVVTTGEYTRAYMVREKGIEPGRVAAIPSGIDLERFDGDRIREDLRGELGIAADTPVFGSTSVFRKKKGYHILLEAVPKIIEVFPTAKLLLVGGGPQENNLRRQIDDLRLGGNVILPGFREDMPRVLNTMDVYVFPTLEEAFPNAVMEAMAMRRPVVASRVGGVPDLIRDGETGYLVAPGDPAAIAERTCSLLLSAERRRELGAKGQRFVRENCSHRLMVRRLEDLYRAIMRERAS
jgi:glycosyltransferase involved in cell wall biosynthesis